MLLLAVLIIVITLLWIIGFPIIMRIKGKYTREYCYWYALGAALLSIVVNVINVFVMSK